MGWSCSSKAGATMDKWSKFCVEQTGSSNVLKAHEQTFFFDVSSREHLDGRITGKIFRFDYIRPDGSGPARQVSTFRIDADGTPSRAPTALKKLGKGVDIFVGAAIGSGGAR